MFCSIKELTGYSLRALDGEIGRARALCFDDRQWTVRHLVVDGSGRLAGHQLLVPSRAISRVDAAQRRIEVALTRRQIGSAHGNDPELRTPHGGGGTQLEGSTRPPPCDLDTLPAAGEPLILPPRGAAFPTRAARVPAAPGFDASPLHSSDAVIGSHLMATDGAVGAIDDLLLDERSWQICYAVVDTHRWLPDRLVLLTTASIHSIDWREHQVRVRVGRAAVKGSPPYRSGALCGVGEPGPASSDTRTARDAKARGLFFTPH